MEASWLNNMFELTLRQMQEGIILSDEKGDMVFINDAAEQIRNVRRDEILGRNMVNCHKPESKDKVLRALDYLRTNNGKKFTRMVSDTRNDRYYENVYSPVFDFEDKLQGFAVISRDITARRKAEELKANYQRAQELAYDNLRAQYHDLMMTSMEMLTNLLEARDLYTNGHSKRVAAICATLYEYVFGIDERYLDLVWAAKLHDIGKICIPDSIVSKPGKLTIEEYEQIKQHSNIAAEIIKSLDPGSRIWPIIRYHHERMDGRGYPEGLKGEEIPDGSRIIAIADAYDAMRSCRPYREAMTFDQSLDEIRRNAGTQFDPVWVDRFLDLADTGSID